MVVSNLQYADDTLMVADCTLGSWWSIKETLRGFELVLWL